MQSIGVITHSASGKDIRRVVARGSTTTNQEKINAVIRMIMAIDAIGAPHVAIMPDPSGIGKRVINEVASQVSTTVVDLLEMPSVLGTESDTTLAVEEMQRNGFACVVVFGGDGTCRAAAKGSAGIPIIAISTGTNNVFPERTESTLAGMAAAYIATRRIDGMECCIRPPL